MESWWLRGNHSRRMLMLTHCFKTEAGKKAVYKYVNSQEVQQMCSMGEPHHTVSLDVFCNVFFVIYIQHDYRAHKALTNAKLSLVYATGMHKFRVSIDKKTMWQKSWSRKPWLQLTATVRKWITKTFSNKIYHKSRLITANSTFKLSLTLHVGFILFFHLYPTRQLK